ncbi:hypothetical protein AYI70_g4254 [Smittium culicis]|uniref:Uncharacterized protein n=1 Tax=Smittium culicis TaxID=133412 RepID=A0A1R1Y0I5_9FUNG|nr:hypothetical protein AYI70_g4254 [Smittium culicis]
MSQEINFNSLAELINSLKIEIYELTREKEPRKDVEMEGENYVVKPPIVDLNSIDLEEETKEVIQACPRIRAMSYSPPQLNEYITNAAKKTDTTLYGIQIALAYDTRLLGNFFYRKYKEDSIAAKEDEVVALASTIRLILASISTNISQIRMENVYQTINIPSKPKKLI